VSERFAKSHPSSFQALVASRHSVTEAQNHLLTLPLGVGANHTSRSQATPPLHPIHVSPVCAVGY